MPFTKPARDTEGRVAEEWGGSRPVRLQSDDSRVTWVKCQYPSNGKKLFFAPLLWCTVESNRLTRSRTIHEHVRCSLFFFSLTTWQQDNIRPEKIRKTAGRNIESTCRTSHSPPSFSLHVFIYSSCKARPQGFANIPIAACRHTAAGLANHS